MSATQGHGDRTAQGAPYEVAIVGGGLVGLTLALALRHSLPAGSPIALVDRAPSPPSSQSTETATNRVGQDIRCVAVSAATVNLLTAVGIWGDVRDQAQPMTDIELTDAALTSPLRPVFLSYENTLDCETPASWVIENAILIHALAARVSADSDTHWMGTTTATGWTSPKDRPVGALTLAGDGTPASQLSARLLAVADGRRSQLRATAGIRTIGWPYDQAGIVTTIQLARPHHGVATQHFLPGGPFAILPMTGDRASLVWSEERSEAARIMVLDDAGFAIELRQRLGARFEDAAVVGPRATWPLDMHLAERMVADRLALIGDAAHGVHPIAGQGYNLAVRDIAALCEIASDAVSLGLDLGGIEPLERYQTWRRFDAMMSALAYDGLNRMFSNDNVLVRAVRGFGLRAVDRLPGVKERLVQEAAGLAGEPPRLLRPATGSSEAAIH